MSLHEIRRRVEPWPWNMNLRKNQDSEHKRPIDILNAIAKLDDVSTEMAMEIIAGKVRAKKAFVKFPSWRPRKYLFMGQADLVSDRLCQGEHEANTETETELRSSSNEGFAAYVHGDRESSRIS